MPRSGVPAGGRHGRVWDPTVSNWKVFDLYTCNRYHFSYWDGPGLYLNHQTGSAVSSVYNQSGGVLHTFTPTTPPSTRTTGPPPGRSATADPAAVRAGTARAQRLASSRR
ncbi:MULTISPECIES: hypothetical protein [Catenuloplanes]|uniref:Uncharacterized protein n=1 Tax=Catenuloplanes niger TaxID=587534 RepID=A0AAE3ZKA1_9ACTN|nr:hypothetical protein [Catenuloplanes niger]MDR7320214.1 hypothetical protein [Catenuloplanes niger]